MKKTYSEPCIKTMRMDLEEDILALSSISEKGATEVYGNRGYFDYN